MKNMAPMIYADFQNADPQGRLRLTCAGTLEDLARAKIELSDGMKLTFYSDDADAEGNPDDMLVDGVVAFSDAEKCWVAVIDWKAIRHASDSIASNRNGELSFATAAARTVG